MDRGSLVERNLASVLNKSAEEIRQMPQETDQFFILKLNKELVVHHNVLYALKNKSFRMLVGIKGGIPATFLGRCPELDGETVSELLNIIAKDLSHQSHPLYSEFGIFIPVPGDYRTSALPIPFFDEFVNMTDPFSVDWSILTNNEKLQVIVLSYDIVL